MLYNNLSSFSLVFFFESLTQKETTIVDKNTKKHPKKDTFSSAETPTVNATPKKATIPNKKTIGEAFSLKNINPIIVIITGSIPITVVALEAEVKLSPINCNIEVRGYVKIPKRINKKKSFLLKFPFSFVF